MMKTLARMVECPGMQNSLEHAMREHCWNCAPFWKRYPVCPVHDSKLATSGFCKTCQKIYAIP